MKITWSEATTLPTQFGTVYLVSGHIDFLPDTGFNGGDVADLTRRELERVAGGRRKSWGRIGYHYGRIKLEGVELLLISAAVLVGKPKGKDDG